MAAPKRNRSKSDDPTHEKTRALIQTTQLVKRLNQYALNKNDEADQKVEIDSGRLKAIDMLLNKSLPSLTAATVTSNNLNINKDASEMSDDELEKIIKGD